MTAFFTNSAPATTSASEVVSAPGFQFDCKSLALDPVTAVVLTAPASGFAYFSQPPGALKAFVIRSLTRPKVLHDFSAGKYGHTGAKGCGVVLVYDLDKEEIRLFVVDRPSMLLQLSDLHKADKLIGSMVLFSTSGEGKGIKYSAALVPGKAGKYDKEPIMQKAAMLGDIDLNNFFMYKDVSQCRPDGSPSPRWDLPKYPDGMSQGVITSLEESAPLVNDSAVYNLLISIATECNFKPESVDIKLSELGIAATATTMMQVLHPIMLAFTRKGLGISEFVLDDESIRALVKCLDFTLPDTVATFVASVNSVAGKETGTLALQGSGSAEDLEGLGDIPF